METSPDTRLYVRGRPLQFKRQLTEDELAHIAARIRKGRMAYRWLSLGGLALFLVLFAVAWAVGGDALDASYVATFSTLLVVGFAALFARDLVTSAFRLKNLPPDSEVLGFGTTHTPGESLIVVPPGLALRVDDQPIPVPVKVTLVQVAPPSERSLSVADWMASEGQTRGNRVLDSQERDELGRLLDRSRPKFRWLDGVLAAYIAFVLYREFRVDHGEPAVTGVLIVLSLGWLAMTARLYWRMRKGHAMVRRSIDRNAVRIVLRDEPDSPARVVEYLLPDGLPWAADGDPAHWRTV
jgi:hypothetical protein